MREENRLEELRLRDSKTLNMAEIHLAKGVIHEGEYNDILQFYGKGKRVELQQTV